jgi:hypothetical protein
LLMTRKQVREGVERIEETAGEAPEVLLREIPRRRLSVA